MWKKLAIGVALVCALNAASAYRADALLDKTRFLAHLGVAYFAFHHWVMKPYGEGAFQQGAPHRTAALVKGGAALLFAYHEVRVSQKIAERSSDPLLQKLDAGLGGLMQSFSSIGQRMKSGQFNPSDVDTLNNQTSTLSSQAAAGGAKIKDVPAAIPGT